MDFNLYVVLLRLLHVGTGVFWAGGVIYLAVFIIPAVKALPLEGGKFMQQLSNTNKFPIVMTLVATTNVITGVLLVYEMSGGFGAGWFGSRMGIALCIGGLSAIGAFITGLTVNKPTVEKMAAIGKTIAASGGPPSAEQVQQLNALRNRLFSATSSLAWMLGFASVCMAIARYI